MATYYDMLGISPTASKAEIKAAIMQRMNTLNAEILDTDDDVIIENINAQIKTINSIRDTLVNDAKRQAYDAKVFPESKETQVSETEIIQQTAAATDKKTDVQQKAQAVKTTSEKSLATKAPTISIPETISGIDFIVTGGMHLGGLLVANKPFSINYGQLFSPLTIDAWSIKNDFEFPSTEEFQAFIKLIQAIRLETLKDFIKFKNGIKRDDYQLEQQKNDLLVVTHNKKALTQAEHDELIDYYRENINEIAENSKFVTPGRLTATFVFR